jgi:hypothetical protein
MHDGTRWFVALVALPLLRYCPVTETLPHAFFRHPDGRWYRLWVTHTEPKTERGRPWHVHASYDQAGAMAPVAGVKWFEQPYGMANWDFDSPEEAAAEFRRRAAERAEHGYELREGNVTGGPRGKSAVAKG